MSDLIKRLRDLAFGVRIGHCPDQELLAQRMEQIADALESAGRELVTGEMLDKLRTLRRAAERTREDLGPTGTNYPDVRILLEFAEKSVRELQAAIAAIGKGGGNG